MTVVDYVWGKSGYVRNLITRELEMPLLPGKKNIGHNIKEMEKAGHPRNQSIAASLNEARKSGVKIPKKKKK